MGKTPAQARFDELSEDAAKHMSRVAELRRKLEQEEDALQLSEARRDAFREAMKLAGVWKESSPADEEPPVENPPAPGRRGGRQPGAITEVWKARLRYFYEEQAEFNVSAVIGYIRDIERADSAPPPSEIARILSNHVKFGYLQPMPLDTYRVTEEAAQKYGFQRPKKFEGPASTGPSSISVSGPAGSPGQLATHDVRDGSIPSGSTLVKNGSLATQAVHHASNPGGGLVM